MSTFHAEGLGEWNQAHRTGQMLKRIHEIVTTNDHYNIYYDINLNRSDIISWSEMSLY